MEHLTDKKFTPADEITPWYPIDNAANLYAGARRKHWCRTYRASVLLTFEVEPQMLQRALNDTCKRFPSMCGKLKDGLFWSYFERATQLPVIEEERDYPYCTIDLEGNNQPNFRVLYYKNRIALENYHALSDGGGSLAFLSALIARYLELKGKLEHPADFYKNGSDLPLAQECEDSYLKTAKKEAAVREEKREDAYLSDQNPEKHFHRFFHGIMRVEDLKAAASKYGMSITEYLSAALIHMFISCAHQPIEKEVRISVPIDLRKRFSSVTMRNFCYMTDVGFVPNGRKDISFEEIAQSIKGKLKQKASSEALLGAISYNVASQQSPVLKRIPYLLKKASLRASYKKNQHSYTTFLSNFGVFPCSDEVAKYIQRAELCLGDTPYMHFGCAAVSVNGIFNFTFSTSNHDTRLPEYFFRFLSSQGIPLRVESNVFEERG